MSLKTIYDALLDIGGYSGKIDKEECIKKYAADPLFKKVAVYALDHTKKYNMTSVEYDQNAKIRPNSDQLTLDNLFKMLDFMADKNGATDEERRLLSYFSSIDAETNKVVNCIVAKDLRVGASVRTFKKFYPEIPEFGLMLCDNEYKKLDKAIKKNKMTLPQCYWSIKLDGVRNYCDYNKSDIKHLSRNGKEYPNFGKAFNENINILADLTRKLFKISSPIFDGEVISKLDNFQNLMTQVKKLKDADPSIFNFFIFDLPIPNVPFYQRYSMLEKLFSEYLKIKPTSNIFLLKHELLGPTIINEISLFEFGYKFSDAGYEGVVIKDPMSMYEPKRSPHWMKIKRFETLDLPVTGWEYGKGRLSDVLGYFTCDHNGVTVEVGSGLSDTQRVEFMTDVPKLIEVKYFEETKDGSLRFPIFVRVRDDK